MRMRISRPRSEFGAEPSFFEKEGGENYLEMKTTQKGTTSFHTKKKVLELGLQAGNKMINFKSQTYYNRKVNAAIQFDPIDFINSMKAFYMKDDTNMNEKLEKFIDRVSPYIEEALQSNELINVFLDDFDVLGDEETTGATSKISAVTNPPRTFFNHTYCKNKRVSSIKFHPTKPHLVAMSMIENLSFDDRADISGKSFDSNVLILNFGDELMIAPNYVLETPIEVSAIEFHPENPMIMVGGCISGQLVIWDVSSVDHHITSGKK